MANLTGKVAIVTGGRVKIGFHTALKLLRMKCTVVVTSRYGADCVLRYSKEKDFAAFADRLHVYSIDFKHIEHIEQFCDFILSSYSRLDILINNACQTIERPVLYKTEMETIELKAYKTICKYGVKNILCNEFTFSSDETIPDQPLSNQTLTEVLDKNGELLDYSKTNSWVLKLGEVSTDELVAVFAINSVAPFILNSKLKALMSKTVLIDKAKNIDDGCYIINVSAMEGKFYRYKNSNHPHTNMAKAALNMLTRTSAQHYAKFGIYMNSVDTGWINDENPLPTALRIHEENHFQTPIDEIDAAARLLDPIISGIVNVKQRVFGKFLKDFLPTEW